LEDHALTSTDHVSTAPGPFTLLMNQNSALVDALAQARRERTEEVGAIRAEADAELARLRKENSDLRKRVDKQWEMEPRRSWYPNNASKCAESAG